jgi:hypothetical protein
MIAQVRRRVTSRRISDERAWIVASAIRNLSWKHNQNVRWIAANSTSGSRLQLAFCEPNSEKCPGFNRNGGRERPVEKDRQPMDRRHLLAAFFFITGLLTATNAAAQATFDAQSSIIDTYSRHYRQRRWPTQRLRIPTASSWSPCI